MVYGRDAVEPASSDARGFVRLATQTEEDRFVLKDVYLFVMAEL